MSQEEKYFYEFGKFRVDPVKRRLMRDGEPVRLTPKAFDTLLILIESNGRTIEKDDLMQRVWPDAVVEENNLNQNISTLRRILGDSRDEGRYIATIPGLGYRFVAEVARVGPEVNRVVHEDEKPVRVTRKLRLVVGRAAEPEEDELIDKPDSIAISADENVSDTPTIQSSSTWQSTPELITSAAKPRKRVKRVVLTLSFIGAVAIAFGVFKLVEFNQTRKVEADSTRSEIEVTIVTRTGTIGTAAISRDGRYIVTSVREAGRESLWLRQVAAPSTREIIPPADVTYLGLTFSLDGTHVYFVRREVSGADEGLYRVPVLGGVPAKVVAEVHSPISLSPDGTRVAFVRELSDESALMISKVDGSNQRKLASRPVTDYFKVPAWSPRGDEIAVSVGGGDLYDINNSVVTVRLEDGSQRPLTQRKWAWTRWVDWLANGGGFLITGRDSHEAHNQIWQVSYPSGEVRRLTNDSKPYYSISLTADSRTVLAVQSQLISDIWVSGEGKFDDARKITFGTGAYGNVSYASDGKFFYSSSASGASDVWMMDADGSNQKQLTANAGVNEDPDVSPDGKYIVFGSNRSGVFNIWRMNSDGTEPLQLTRGGGEKFPQCSPDSKWVVYNSVAPEQDFYAIWKVPIDGGEPSRLTYKNTSHPAISPDGSRIAYFYRDESRSGRYKIAVIPFDGGSHERTFDVPQDLDLTPYVRWFSDGQSLTYSAARNGVYNIWTQPLGGGAAKQLTDLKTEGRLIFDWSRDGKQLVFVRRLWTNDLVLLRNFSSLGVPGRKS